jgi:hypothetical protein
MSNGVEDFSKVKSKAISLLQPWATLVVIGAKTIETRSWSTPYRGRLLIHASLGKAGSIFANDPPFSNYIESFKQLPFGKIIGEVTLTSILRVEDLDLPDAEINKLTLEEKAFGDYTKGRYAWLLEDAIAYEEPYHARGHLRLWDLENIFEH